MLNNMHNGRSAHTSLTFIDIDDSLFFTQGKIKVINKNTKELKVVLTNKEFNTYKMLEEDELDYSDFLSSDIFADSSTPNHVMIEKLQGIFNNTKISDSELYLLTARPDLDDKEKFLNFFIHHGIPVGHKDNGDIHILRAGNEEGNGSSEKKCRVIRRMLEQDHNFKVVTMYDDALVNLDGFLALAEEYEDIKFECFLIDHLEIIPYKGIK